MNAGCVINLVGRLCLVLAGLLLAPLLVCLADGTLGGPDTVAFGLAAGISLALGLLLRAGFTFRAERFTHNEAFAIVTLGWLVFMALGALPFLITGAIPAVVDACFETMSGATTTGASVLADPATLSRPLLFWRALLHLVGGLGIVALSVAILPALGAGGNFLFQAEAVGPEKGKLLPRISSMSKLLWGVYLGLAAATVGGYLLAGMGAFDALCHGFATVGTGGFSTRADSLAGYGAPVQWAAVLFMFLAGTNFVLLLAALRGRPGQLWRSTEFRTYLALTLGVALLCMLVRRGAEGGGWEELARSSLFTVVSLTTTTGFGTVDFDLWPPVLHVALLFMMFCGACAGSTGGGCKMSRLVLWWKSALRELRGLSRPASVTVVTVQGHSVSDRIVARAVAFLLAMTGLWLLLSLALMATGLGAQASFSAVLASLSCVGPGFDAVGPTRNYGALPDTAKWILVGAMLLGRLELYCVLALFSRMAWRR